MKKNVYAASLILLALALLAGCFNSLSAPLSGNASGSQTQGMNRVYLRFGVADARTLLPDSVDLSGFAASVFVFTPTGDDGRKTVTLNSATDTFDYTKGIELETGAWELELAVYSDVSLSAQSLVAQTDAPVTFTVSNSAPASIVVPLVFKSVSGSGTFSWNITNSTGAAPDQSEITLTLLASPDTVYTFGNTLSGSKDAVTAGYYLVTMRLEKDLITPIDVYNDEGRYTPATGIKRWASSDILHIYPGQTTNLTNTFESDKFFSGVSNIWLFGDMTDWDMANNMPQKEMAAQADGTFTWTGDAAADSYFRFSLTDTSAWTPATDDNLKKGAWFAPAANGQSVVTTSAGNTWDFIPLGQGGVNTAWKLDAGYYQITVDPIGGKFFVDKPDIVTDVTVSGP
ncbi:MAG: hypothetical protein FWF29_05695, partial [Treponema sp.]|nr:hypothetical protein [Treponema sp.]